MNEKAKPTDTPAPAAQKKPPSPELAAIRASVKEQSETRTRFEAGKYKRKETDAAGNPVSPKRNR